MITVSHTLKNQSFSVNQLQFVMYGESYNYHDFLLIDGVKIFVGIALEIKPFYCVAVLVV